MEPSPLRLLAGTAGHNWCGVASCCLRVDEDHHSLAVAGSPIPHCFLAQSVFAYIARGVPLGLIVFGNSHNVSLLHGPRAGLTHSPTCWSAVAPMLVASCLCLLCVGTLQAMRAYAQPNGRFDLITHKRTVPGNKHEPCPFPGSYAPATVRYIFAYLLPPGSPKPQTLSMFDLLFQARDVQIRPCPLPFTPCLVCVVAQQERLLLWKGLIITDLHRHGFLHTLTHVRPQAVFERVLAAAAAVLFQAQRRQHHARRARPSGARYCRQLALM